MKQFMKGAFVLFRYIAKEKENMSKNTIIRRESKNIKTKLKKTVKNLTRK